MAYGLCTFRGSVSQGFSLGYLEVCIQFEVPEIFSFYSKVLV